MKKLILLIFALIIIVSSVKAEAVYFIRSQDIPTLEESYGCKIININQSLTLTQDKQNTCYLIDADNIVLNCNDNKIIGNDKGFGVYTQSHYVTRPCNVNPSGICGELVETKNITIKNCIITNFASGIVTSHTNGEIINNILQNNKGAGITIPGKNIKIENNTILNNKNGAILTGDNNKFNNNIIKDNQELGLEVGYCNHPITYKKISVDIQNNQINNNNIGISLACLEGGSLHDYILNNNVGIKATVKDYTINSNRIIAKENGVGLTITGENLTITQNEITGENSETGIKLSSVNNLKIKQNQINGFSTCISMPWETKLFSNSEISSNEITCNFGMNLDSHYGSTNNKLFNNNIKSERGIMLRGNNNQIKDNILTRNSNRYNYGIQSIGNNSLIENNQILNKFGWGIKVNGNSNTIKNNIIERTIWGAVITEGQNNIQENNQIDVSNTSFIQNNGNETIKFYSAIKLEYKNNSKWIYKTSLVAGSFQTLAPGESYDISKPFNMYGRNLRKLTVPGQYRLRLQLNKAENDTITGILTRSDGTPVEAYHEFAVVQQNFFMKIVNNIKNAFT